MRTWALVNTETNVVENIIKWDGITDWRPPDGFICIECSEGGDIGDTYENETFIKPSIEPTETQQSSNSELQIIG